jgi:hypothetical protein
MGWARNLNPSRAASVFHFRNSVRGYPKPGYNPGCPDHPGPHVIHLQRLHHNK